MSQLFSYPKSVRVNASGLPYAHAKMYWYAANTLNAQTVYQDVELTTAHTQPIDALDDGYFPPVYLDESAESDYRLILKTSGGALIDDLDDIPRTTLTADVIRASLYPITPTEQGLGLASVDESYPLGYLLRYADNASPGTTDMTAALQYAVNAVGNGGTVMLPAQVIKYTGLALPANSINIQGAAKGNASYESTVLQYYGAGVALTVPGYYCHLSDFSIDNLGTGTVGILMSGNHIILDRVSLTGQNGANAWSAAAFQSNPAAVAFTHTLRNCYTLGHIVGWDVAQGNNMVCDNSFFESNQTNILIGRTGTVNNMVICNGTVLELFGDGRSNEILSSLNVDAQSVNGLVVRDCYFEVDGTGAAGAANQRAVYLRSGCKGVVIEGNEIYGGGQATGAITIADPSVDGVVIRGNAFADFNGYAVVGATSGSPAQAEISGNACTTGTTGEYDNTWTPAISFGGGTTGITYTSQFGRWQRYGKFAIVKATIQLSAKGSSTGTAVITGIPAGIGHVTTANSEDSGPLTVGNCASIAGGCTVQVKPGSPTTANLYSAGAGGGQVALDDTNFNNNSYLSFTLMYQVAT